MEAQGREVLRTGIHVSSVDPQAATQQVLSSEQGYKGSRDKSINFPLISLRNIYRKLLIEETIKGGISYQRGFLYLIITI